MKTAQTQVIANIQQAQPTIEALDKIDPLTLILRVQCAYCLSIFAHDAGYISKMTRAHGFFRPSKLCPDCRTSRLEKKKEQLQKKLQAKVKSTPKAKKQIKKNIKPVAKKPQPQVKLTPQIICKHKDDIAVNQPFKTALAGVKIEPEGSKTAGSEK